MKTAWVHATATIVKEYLVEVDAGASPNALSNIVDNLIYEDCNPEDVVIGTIYMERPKRVYDEVIEIGEYFEEEDV